MTSLITEESAEQIKLPDLLATDCLWSLFIWLVIVRKDQLYLCQLGLVESRPGLQLIVPLVTPQCVDLQLEKIHLKPQQRQRWSFIRLPPPPTGCSLLFCLFLSVEQTFQSHYLRHLHIMIWRLSTIIAGLPLPLVANALNEVLMEVTDVKVPHLKMMSQQWKWVNWGTCWVEQSFLLLVPNLDMRNSLLYVSTWSLSVMSIIYMWTEAALGTCDLSHDFRITPPPVLLQKQSQKAFKNCWAHNRTAAEAQQQPFIH